MSVRPSISLPACLQVDFSQSVYHLWKQFRRFGPKGGDAGSGQQPNPGAGGGDPRLQMLSSGRYELKVRSLCCCSVQSLGLGWAVSLTCML
jgi:hypothetical protein